VSGRPGGGASRGPDRVASAAATGTPAGWRRALRLWQPQRGLFWLMLAFNALGSGCAWAFNLLELNAAGLTLFAIAALLNSGAGLLAAWKLLQLPAPGESTAASAARAP
jgi:hypothetical protein